MIEINKNVVFVKGAKNGAIYDFNTEKVFSINDIAVNIIERYVFGKSIQDDFKYLDLLSNNKLISKDFKCCEYMPKVNSDVKLNLAWIEITNVCNLRCIHCYEGDVHAKLNDSLTLEEWKQVIDELVGLKVKTIIVIGGEPTCSKFVCEILEYISHFDVKTTLFTNAVNIDDKLFETIVKTNTMVKTSVYGHTKEIHDSITQVNGSFDKMVKNITRLKEVGIDVTSSIIIMKENEKYVDEIVEFTKKIGMTFNRYDVIRNVYGGKQDLHTPITEKIINKAYRNKPNFKITKELFDSAFTHNTCWYGKIAIKENGEVIPCEFERNFIYGNIKQESLKNIISGKKILDKWFLDYSKIEICKDCEFRFGCKDCRPLAISVCGEMNSKNPRCKYNPYIGVWEK